MSHGVVEQAKASHEEHAIFDFCVQAAHGRLDNADVVLKGPEGRMTYRPLHAQLVGRRCRMACTLATVYSVGPQTGALLQSLLGCLFACQVMQSPFGYKVKGQELLSSRQFSSCKHHLRLGWCQI